MNDNLIELHVRINVPIKNVWRVFTDREITKKMGGYYDTNWEIGSSFGFKKIGGDSLTNGVLMELAPYRLIKHSLFYPNSERLMAVITYEFHDKEHVTILAGKEELTESLDKESYKDAVAGWEFALKQVKEIAESIES
ncbi:SRPBCC family protein [Olivibacter jilunii]|uniref:SRPBCC family protein n=1 Tax=Olivibacter jilunii TaxID=985016 RepID=UPI003F18C4B8